MRTRSLFQAVEVFLLFISSGNIPAEDLIDTRSLGDRGLSLEFFDEGLGSAVDDCQGVGDVNGDGFVTSSSWLRIWSFLDNPRISS